MKPSQVNQQCKQLIGGTVTNIDYDYTNYVFTLNVLTDSGAETEVLVVSDGYDDGIEVYI